MEFKLGIENFLHHVSNKPIAMLTNASGVTQDLIQNIDIMTRKGAIIRKIFAPEHGIYAALKNGEEVLDETYSGIPVKSIYSSRSHTIDPKELENVESVIYDIQDGGARPYTYISSLKHLLTAAAKAGVAVIVCDRPAPLSGSIVDGPMLQSKFRSFVGIDDFPLRYGMTIGEMAQYLNRDVNADLKISTMSGYKRSYYYDAFLKHFVPPSLNLPTLNALFVFVGMVLVESSKASLGRGTPYPFSQFGYSGAWSLDLKEERGALFRKIKFIPGLEPLPGQSLEGFSIHIEDRKIFRSITLAIRVLKHLFSIDPENIDFKHLSILYGSDELKKFLEDSLNVNEIAETWVEASKDFMEARSAYLLYD
jgi:uncharacterized protein YbbC (DUF1343 family)